MKFWKLASVAIAFVLSTSTNAAIISADWHSPSDNLLTLDTVTGLQWLDLTESVGLSYNDVINQMGVGGNYEGMRYANESEVMGLLSQFGFTSSNHDFVDTDGIWRQRINNVESFFGDTFSSDPDAHGFSGIYAPTPEMPDRLARSAHAEEHTWLGEDLLLINIILDNGLSKTYSMDTMGSFLVIESSPVPVPAAVWLFGSGLIGLVGFARRKKA